MKLVISYIIYFILLYLFYFVIGIMNGTVVGTICGILIFLVLTVMLGIITYSVLKAMNDQIHKFSVKIGVDEKDLPEIERLKLLNNSYKAKLSHNNLPPFNDYNITIISTVDNIIEKYANIMKLLQESFSVTDLTFAKYTSTLDTIIKTVRGNLKAIIKRTEVFDYKGWSRICNSVKIMEICKEIQKDQVIELQKVASENELDYLKYLVEVKDYIIKTTEISEKLNKLTHELVCLETLSDAPLQELTALIEQTKDYKNI